MRSETSPLNLGMTMIPRQSALAEAVEISNAVACRYERLLPDMKLFYYDEGLHLTDEELFLQIDKRFGPRLTREVCEPLGFFQGACALIGMLLLRQADR